MAAMVRGADGKRLRYADLIENSERACRRGARAALALT